MVEKLKQIKNPVTGCLLLLCIPIIVILGAVIFREKYYAWISLCVAVITCLPLFYCFERKESSSKELIVIAVMVALSVAGRFIFAWLPGFKPVTAMTIIAAVWLGKEAGFAVGSFTAVISNFYFGQGPWTPFQMFAWGVLGFIAGLLSKQLQKRKITLYIFGAFSGILFSFVMDIWTTVWAEGDFRISRYIAILVSSLPVTIEYAVSNVIFLLILAKPIAEKLDRIKKKYGLFLTN